MEGPRLGGDLRARGAALSVRPAGFSACEKERSQSWAGVEPLGWEEQGLKDLSTGRNPPSATIHGGPHTDFCTGANGEFGQPGVCPL